MKKNKINNKFKNKTQFSSSEVIILMIISLVLGMIVCFVLFFGFNSKSSKYVKVDSDLQSVLDTYNNVINNYYDDVDKKSIVDGAISGMLASVGDPYTTYMDQTTYDNFNITLAGSYSGLGLEISSIDNKLVIAGIFNDSPASEAGLKLGDVIVSIDDKKSPELSSADFSKYVRSSEKSSFNLIIERDSKQQEVIIEKKNITLKSVTSKLYKKDSKKIGYIYVSIFASNTFDQFKNELNNLEKQNIDSLIIDLRNNSGGELFAASNMISLFLNNDKIMYQTDTKGQIEKFYSTGTKDASYKIGIIINSNSASASEVLTSSLKDNLNATIFGEKSYGKGTVQEMVTLSNGEQYKMTTAKWLTANGDWINKSGIKPDVEVKLSNAYNQNPSEDNDNQLQTAVNYMKEH